MRVTPAQLNTVVRYTHQYFGDDAKIWLFGSRVDDKKRGGDYDFLVETQLDDANEIIDRKIALLTQLQSTAEFEDEKIDLVVKRSASALEIPIYQVAKIEGTQI